jgi:preprotein translocase subunit SecE
VVRAVGEQNWLVVVKDLIVIGIWAAVIGTLFVVLWRKGALRQLTEYVQQTREELRKCTWPTWDELKGSTVIVGVSIFILGFFTVLVDQVLIKVFVLFKL